MSCAALVFDVDGTLADTEEVHRQAFNRAFRESGLQWSWDPPLYARLLQVTGGKERMASYLGRLRLSEAEARRVCSLIPRMHLLKNRFYKEMVELGQIRLRTGVRRLLLEARDAGMRVAIASTTSPENIEPLIAAALGRDALSWFATIACGDVVAHKKPAPDIYNVALHRLRVRPAQAVAIEDSAIGVKSAKAAGLFTIATPNVWTQTQDFSGADLLLGSLGDPGQPLTTAEQLRVGAGFLSLERLRALHSAATAGAHLEGMLNAKAY